MVFGIFFGLFEEQYISRSYGAQFRGQQNSAKNTCFTKSAVGKSDNGKNRSRRKKKTYSKGHKSTLFKTLPS